MEFFKRGQCIFELVCPSIGTHYRALSAESSTAFGLNPNFVVHDELGQVRGPRSPLFEALETATGAQENPLSIIISTQASTDNDLLSVLIDDALAGHDPQVTVTLFTAPPELDPFDIKTIRLANPALGKFLQRKEVMGMADAARRMPASEASFRNLILNQRIEAANPFVSPTEWRACGEQVESLRGVPVYAGLDLSSVADLTAFVMIGRHGKVWHCEPTFWLPSVGLYHKAQKDRTPYDQWAKDGYLQTTEGATISYEFVAQFLFEMFQRYDIRKVAFDRWGFAHFKPWLVKAGFNDTLIEDRFVQFGQGTQTMSPALRDLEQAIKERQLAHGNHPVLGMCAACAVVEGRDYANRKLSKNKSSGRIDGLVALTMAMGVAPLQVKPVDIEALIG